MTASTLLLLALAGCRTESEPESDLVPVEVLPGSLHVPERHLDFGDVALHETTQLDLVLSNTGEGTLYVHDLQLEDDTLRPHWTIMAPVEHRIVPGATTLLPISLKPMDVIDPTVLLTVVSSDPTTPRFAVELTAKVHGTPVLRAEPELLEFGEVEVGATETLDVHLSNLGNDTLLIDTVTLEGDTPFTLAVDPSGSSLEVLASHGLVSVTYAPDVAAGHTAMLTITSNDTANPEQTIPVTGTGTQ